MNEEEEAATIRELQKEIELLRKGHTVGREKIMLEKAEIEKEIEKLKEAQEIEKAEWAKKLEEKNKQAR